jgi:hypothetical protein
MITLDALDLRSTTLESLWAFFAGVSHDLSSTLRAALEDVVDCLVRMAEGTCEPVYYLSSLDPRVGKTQAVVHFLRALVASPEHRDVGVLIGVARLDEVRAYVKAASLSEGQFAVLTSDNDLNALGSGKPTSSQVLFTTQQMIEKRTAGRPMEATSDFRFRGRARQVRVWDEALIPAQPITLPLDDLGLLIRRYRPLNRELAEQLEELRDTLKQTAAGEGFGSATVEIPDLASAHHLNVGSGLSLLTGAPDEELQAAASLWQILGQQITLRRDGRYGLVLVHLHEHLPEDLPPTLILDASGRVRETYRLWQKHRGNLVRLREAAKNYRNLRIHIWQGRVARVVEIRGGGVGSAGLA